MLAKADPFTPPQSQAFTSQQKMIIAILVFLQFTIILDFMILSPLGAILMPALNITPAQFGLVVSAYAFSAGISGFLSAGFADRFDRKKLLLFFYGGFVIGTLMCGLAPDYTSLLIARTITGIFGGVIGSIVFAIVTDLFPMHMRGRVMGAIQTSFAASQVMGLPLGLYFANNWGWHAPFIMIVVAATAASVFIFKGLPNINAHLALQTARNPFQHLLKTVSKGWYLQAFGTVALMSLGGFMLMPFGSAFSVNNMKIDIHQIPFMYMITGSFTIISGPLIGSIADKYGKFNVFAWATIIGIGVVIFYTRLQETPFWLAAIYGGILFATVSGRMVASGALMSAIPGPADRGSFMAVSSSIQQVAGGFAAGVAGMIVYQPKDQPLVNFDILGLCVAGAMLITLIAMYFINKKVTRAGA